MAWLHENKEEFRNAILFAAEQNRIAPAAVEKDYYVTLILKGLKERLPFIVFKGGTSLSKCHKAIRRFSEDIDVTIDTKLSQGQMGKVKDAIKAVAEELGLTIPNIDETRSRRNYNKYLLAYDPVIEMLNDDLQPMVILETSFAEVSFPTVILPVHSYIGDMMEMEAPEMLEPYGLLPFEMKVQGIDRTMIDKVFAICDYYMKGDVRRHSRHIYDIYKLETSGRFDPLVLVSAVEATFKNRKSDDLIPKRYEILESIRRSGVVGELWRKYQIRFPYAAGISLEAALMSAKKLFDLFP